MLRPGISSACADRRGTVNPSGDRNRPPRRPFASAPATARRPPCRPGRQACRHRGERPVRRSGSARAAPSHRAYSDHRRRGPPDVAHSTAVPTR